MSDAIISERCLCHRGVDVMVREIISAGRNGPRLMVELRLPKGGQAAVFDAESSVQAAELMPTLLDAFVASLQLRRRSSG